MENIVTFVEEKQLTGPNNGCVMIDETENRNQSYSEEEVKQLLTERLKRIAEGDAVLIPHDEVKNHIKALLRDEYQMA